MENESKTYVIYNVLPPYAKATEGSAAETHDLQFGQKYPHMEANPSPSAPPVKSANQEHVLEQNKSEDEIKRRTKGSKSTTVLNLCCKFWASVCGTICGRICATFIAALTIGIIFVLYKTL